MSFDWERLGDRINPIVLHELRRGLRSRVFSVSFALLLAACVVIALIQWLASRTFAEESGEMVFMAFYACLALVGFFILPFSAFRSVVREREPKTWSLVALTRLSPSQILRGKILAFAVQAVLFGSVAAPFLFFSYLLQGMALSTMLVVLAMSVCFQLFLTTLCAALATLPETPFWRGALQFVVLGGLAVAGQLATAMAGAAIFEVDAIVSDPEVLLALGVLTWLMVSGGAILFTAGASRLTFASDDYARAPRLAMAAMVLGSLLLAVIGRSFVSGTHWGPAVTVPLLALLFLFGSISIGERNGLPRRLRENPPRFTLLGLLLPGGLRGFRFFVLLTLLTGAVGILLCHTGARPRPEFALPLAGITAFTLLFVSLAVILGRGPLRGLVSTPNRMRVFSLLLALAGSIVPPVLAVLLGLRGDHDLFNALNPVFSALIWLEEAGRSDHSTRIELICTVGIVAAMVGDRILAYEEKRTATTEAVSTEAAGA